MSNELWNAMSEEDRNSTALGIAENLARGRHDDYDDYVSPSLLEEAGKDPDLRHRLSNAADPAEEIYNVAKERHAEATSLDVILGG